MYHGGYKFGAAQVSFPSLQVETFNYFNERQEFEDRTKWTLYNLEKSQKSDLKTLKISSPSKTLGVD